jgi:hypothetical protein
LKQQPNWYDLDMLPLYLELSGGQLEASLEQLQNLEACKGRPYLLDNDTVERIIKLASSQNETNGLFIEQCRRWRQQNPTSKQLEDIGRVEHFTKRLEKTNNQLLFLATHFKGHTIEQILKKDDAELALNYLLGNLYDPLKEPLDDITPLGPGSSHDLRIFNNPDEQAIKTFYRMQPKGLLTMPASLAKTYQAYVSQREALNDFHQLYYEEGMEEIIAISKELGNFDPVEEVAVIQNEAEMNAFCDYFVLYRQRNGKRFIEDWLEQNPKVLNSTNEKVVKAYCNARFAVLRLDKNLDSGGLQVVDIISQKPYLLMDKALNASQREGCFFCCSLLDMGDYTMTSGGGITLDGHSTGGKAVLTLINNDQEHLQKPGPPLTPEIAKAVRKIYGFCLRNGSLTYMTANDVY